MSLKPGLHPVESGQLAAVVTYLEMTAAQVRPPKAIPEGISIVQENMSLADYRAVFKAIGAPWLWVSRLTASDDELSAILTDPRVETWPVRQNGDIVGIVELDFRIDQKCELAFFGLIPSATGQGIGGPMMALAQKQAFSRPIEVFHVHTCSLDDPAALNFYRKAGFTAVKRDVEIFDDPRLSGVHTKHSAPQIPII